MNIWTDINPKRITPDDFIACIEIEQGSKNKYELDKETGLIILDRVLYTSTHYPMNYGFIPHTYSGDNDPLDVFVLCSQPIEKMSLVRCYPIGVVNMIDRDEVDEKIIAIPFGDPQYNVYKDVSELPSHIIEELRHFLTVYKQLENKTVEVHQVDSAKIARETIRQNIEEFERHFPDKR
ncbi:MAG: inorganic diphosphatase [Eubacteriales bacterium]|nr:inorganic diphosphatase [Eubacteriales bacterium]